MGYNTEYHIDLIGTFDPVERHIDNIEKRQGFGQQRDDIWIKYFHRGKVHRANADLLFDSFDMDKLEEPESGSNTIPVDAFLFHIEVAHDNAWDLRNELKDQINSDQLKYLDGIIKASQTLLLEAYDDGSLEKRRLEIEIGKRKLEEV
jgi:hypothetical protein